MQALDLNSAFRLASIVEAIHEPTPVDRLRELVGFVCRDLQAVSRSQRESQDSCEQIQVPRLSSEPHNP